MYFIKRLEQFGNKVNNDIHKIKQGIQKITDAQKNLVDMEKCLQQNNEILINGLKDTETDPYESVIEIIDNKMDIRLDKKRYSLLLSS